MKKIWFGSKTFDCPWGEKSINFSTKLFWLSKSFEIFNKKKLVTETDVKLQFLAQEIVIVGEENFMRLEHIQSSEVCL